MHILLSTIVANLLIAVNPVKKGTDDGVCNVCDDDLYFPLNIDQLEGLLHNTTKVAENTA